MYFNILDVPVNTAIDSVSALATNAFGRLSGASFAKKPEKRPFSLTELPKMFFRGTAIHELFDTIFEYMTKHAIDIFVAFSLTIIFILIVRYLVTLFWAVLSLPFTSKH